MFDVNPVTTERPFWCGPACLKMLLEFYGIEADLAALAKECKTGMSGCSMAMLSRVGKAHGLQELKAWQMDAEELIRQDRPAIIWWRYNHYVVFCGRNENGDVVICNPARGRYPIDPGSFAAMYTGLQQGTGAALFNGEPHDLSD